MFVRVQKYNVVSVGDDDMIIRAMQWNSFLDNEYPVSSIDRYTISLIYESFRELLTECHSKKEKAFLSIDLQEFPQIHVRIDKTDLRTLTFKTVHFQEDIEELWSPKGDFILPLVQHNSKVGSFVLDRIACL